MNPIDELKTEHRAIEGALDLFVNLAGRLAEAPQTHTASDARQMLDFFQTFTDACHHGKEEGFLFPALEAIGVSRQGGPIGVMLHEHDQGRALMAELRRALDAHAAGDRSAAAAFRAHAEAYREFLRQHIQKEDQVLFRIAAERLPQAKLAELARDFERLEEERIGHGRHEELHRMLEAFEKAYGTAR